MKSRNAQESIIVENIGLCDNSSALTYKHWNSPSGSYYIIFTYAPLHSFSNLYQQAGNVSAFKKENDDWEVALIDVDFKIDRGLGGARCTVVW